MSLAPGFERLAVHAMGTRFEMALAGASPVDLRSAGEAAFEEVLDLHARWSAFDPGSLLTRVNRLAAGRAVPVDGETFAVLELARTLWRATDGAFDPTVGAVMRAHGFRGTRPFLDAEISIENRGREESPESATPFPGMAAVELDRSAGTVRFLDRRVELDLGALAKGFALDRVGESLRENGVPCALVHGGTSAVIAIGSPPDSDGWPIALDRDGRVPSVRLCDAALAVSAGHGRVVEDGAARKGHVLDPATLDPAPIDRFAAVVTDSAAEADAWATAWLVTDLSSRTPAELSVLAGRAEDGAPVEVAYRIDPRGCFSSLAE